MKRLILFLSLALTACTPKDNPGGSGQGVAVKAALPAASAMPDKLCVYIDGVTYSKHVSYQSLSQDKVLSSTIELPVAALIDEALLPVYVIDQNGEVYSGTLPLSENKTKLEGSLAVANYVDGDGTKVHPFLIANARQLKNMMTFYQNASQPANKNSFKYSFALTEDVSAAGFAWIPLNNSGSFYKAVDFNGNGHSISGLHSENVTYASFAGVLYGEVRNVTFYGATISHNNTKKGVVAGFLGTDGLPGSCENVKVDHSTVSGGSYSGGFAGHVRSTGSITGCSVSNTTVTSTNSHVGGFAAALDLGSNDKYEVPARFVDCHVVDVTVNQNSTSTADLYTGGFIGGSVQSGSYKDCTVKAIINAKQAALPNVGGFVGRTSYAGSNFQGCAVKNGTVISAKGDRVGGFVGYAETADSYNKCEAFATVSSSGNYAGGFAGYANGASSFAECAAYGSITGAQYVGGFVGGADNASFRASSVKEMILSAESCLGGFVGNLGAAAFTYDYSDFSLNGSASSVGAFAGYNTSDQAAVLHCIGWDANHELCGSPAVAGSQWEYNYNGKEQSVSYQAAQHGWPASSWDFDGFYPVLKADARSINAIFVGDSITWQWGRNEGEYSKDRYPLYIPFNPAYMIDNGTTVTVKFHPGFFSRNGYIDKGISGQNTTQMKARFQKDVIAVHPYVVVIMAGTNDLAQGVSEAGIRDNIAAMAAEAAAAGIKVVLCSVTPNNSSYSKLVDPNTKGAHIIRLNNLLQTLCTEKGYSYCDYWTSLVDEDGLSMKKEYWLYDMLHPGPDGYDVMEPIIKPIIDALL